MTERTPLQLKEEDFKELRNPPTGYERIKNKLELLEDSPIEYLRPWLTFSRDDGKVYPDQGIVETPYDYLESSSKQMLTQEKVMETLRLRLFLLEMSNHPYKMHFLKEVQEAGFRAPRKIRCLAIEHAEATGLSLSVGDLGASVTGADREKQSRTQRYAEGPFVMLGKQARMIFTGSDSPDVWNTSASISTMAASHCLATIPRNGIMTDVKRQKDLARGSFAKLDDLKSMILGDREDAEEVANLWKGNVGAVLESAGEKALRRAVELFGVGVRTFRIYSPEPGTEIIDTTRILRREFGNEIEIFSGQVIDIIQARKLEEAGADGIFVGIGGGGRCITGVRSGSVIDWPMLVWNLRGQINIPIVVEGGASDHIAVSLLLGATAISTSRVVAGGTIESPGGILYCSDGKGKLFKPYGGEASARTKFLEGKVLPFDIPSFVEGETSEAELSYIKHVLPTLTYNLHLLNEEAILTMVFRNVATVEELHAINPSPLKRSTGFDFMQRNTH